MSASSPSRSKRSAPPPPAVPSNPGGDARKALLLELADRPNSGLLGAPDASNVDLLLQLYDQSALLALTNAPEDACIYGPPVFPTELVTGVRSPEVGALFRACLRQILSNVRLARLNLTTAKRSSVLSTSIAPGASVPPAGFPAKAAAEASPRSDKAPAATGRPANPKAEAKLNQSVDALRRVRKALRHREHIENLASRAQAAIAKYTAEGQNAPRALRDYRHRANVHVTQLSLSLDALIKRTAEIEDVPPPCPGRHSPPAQTPASLGEPPISDPVAPDFALTIPDFSRPFASELVPVAERAKAVASYKKRREPESPDEEPAEESEPSRSRRRRT
jgi:hypothetical protein